jgi:antitoxin (DNA-binding transcriptional repressor) of toxin-antitoxin stability system
MYHMKRASVRDLRYRFPEIEQILCEGGEIQITKRKRVIARLVPEAEKRTPTMPDFLSRLKKLYRKPLKATGAEIVAKDREERF